MKIYTFPKEYEKRSKEYNVSYNGEKIEVYSCDVSAIPFNQVWPGYQRDKAQTEEGAFVMLSSDKEVTLDITPKRSFEKVTVRPLSRKIEAKNEVGKIQVTFPGTGQYTVEFDDSHNVLAVFINPEKDFGVDKNDKNVLYFGPGVHYVEDRISLCDNQTVFIDEGAVLYGAIEAVDKKNIKIVGYGIVDNSFMERGDEINGCAALAPDTDKKLGNPIFLNRCENAVIEGVTIVNSSGWSIYLDGCNNVLVDNIKLIGMWRYNADGCDFCNCQNSSIKNSFLRTFDDCIVVKGFKLNNNLPVENILADNCVLWCDWGRNLEVGAETSAPYIKNITYRNCDVIYGCHVVLDIQHGDRAEMSNVNFEDIRIEYREKTDCPALQMSKDAKYENEDEGHTPILFEIVAGTNMWAIDKESGTLSDVRFKNITITTEDGRIPKDSKIYVRDNEEKIDGVTMENIVADEKVIDAESVGLKVGNGVKNILWK